MKNAFLIYRILKSQNFPSDEQLEREVSDRMVVEKNRIIRRLTRWFNEQVPRKSKPTTYYIDYDEEGRVIHKGRCGFVICSKEYIGSRSDTVFCSSKCKSRHHKWRNNVLIFINGHSISLAENILEVQPDLNFNQYFKTLHEVYQESGNG